MADDETPIYWRHTNVGRVQVYPCAADRAPPCMDFVEVDGHLCGRCYHDARTHGGMATPTHTDREPPPDAGGAAWHGDPDDYRKIGYEPDAG